MAATAESKWIQLNEPDPALQICVMTFPSGKRRLVVVGGDSLTDKQRAGLDEMGFVASHSGLLIREKLAFTLADVRRVFPQATAVTMPMSRIFGDEVTDPASEERPDGAVQVRARIKTASPLGRNVRGEVVYQAEDGRFVRRGNASLVTEDATTSPAIFLYGHTEEDMALCADGFVREIAEGRVMRFDDLRKAAAVVTETPVDKVVYTSHMREFQEAVEAALGRYLNAHAASADAKGYALAKRLEEGQPSFHARTSGSVTRQQYSTPLSMSVAAQHILGEIKGRSVLEPTIGNASLVSMLKGALVTGVELDPDRVAQARHGYPDAAIIESDATTADFRKLNDGAAFDAVIANPPFGGLKAPVSMHGLRITRLDHLILMRALEARSDTGVGVFIIGADSAVSSKAGKLSGGSRYLFNWLADHYDTDVVEIDGKMFAKQGSTYPIRMVVVHGKGASAHPIPDDIDVLKDHDALWAWSERMVAKRLALAEAVVADAPESPIKPEPETAAGGRVEEPDPGSPMDEPAARPESTPDPQSVPEQDDDAENELLDGNVGTPPMPEPVAEENSYQSPYAPASALGEAAAMIPRNLATPTRDALAQVTDAYGDIDEFVADRLEWTEEELAHYLSPEQIDAVALAIARSDEGRGFLEGDQTGLGKGRVMAAMARYTALRGQRTVFLTETATLFTDLWRDIRDINSEALFTPMIVNAGVSIWDPVTGAKLVPSTSREAVQRMIQAGKVDDAYNLVLATYSQFNREAAKSAKARWIPVAAQDATLLLDEAHNAAGDSNTGENIRTAIEGAATVAYSSATSIKQSKNVLLYSKLFPSSVDIGQLPETLSAGGEVLQEVLSGMLASDGVFIRREHDLSALTFYTITDTARQARNRGYSDKLARILELMNFLAGDINLLVNERNKEIKKLLDAIPEAERKGNRMGAISMNFGSRLFAIYRQFQLAIKSDLAAEEAITALEEGKKPVIVLESTMESLLRDLVVDQRETLEDDEAPNLTQAVTLAHGMTFRDVLRRMLDRLTYYVETTGYGEKQKVPLTSEDSLRAVKHIAEQIEEFPDLAVSPLDDIRERIAAAGYRCDELSGRKLRLETHDGKQLAAPVVERPKAHVVKDFNTGASDALLLTRAGSTGISLHASETFPDKRQRVMIELQSAADVNRRVQFFGRVNRKGQVSAPEIRTLSSGLIGESRPIAMQNAKLRKLSANTTANQDNAALDQDVPDVINEIGDQVAQRYLETHPSIARRLDIDMERGAEPSEAYYANKLTSRLVMLTNDEQEQIYAHLTKEYKAIIAELDAKGINPLRSREFDVKARLVKREVFEAGNEASSSAFQLPVYVNTIEHDEVLEPMRSKDISEQLLRAENALVEAKLNPGELEPRPLMLALRDRLQPRWHRGQEPGDLLQDALPQRFKTVEEALGDKESNAVKRLYGRLSFLHETLSELDLGLAARLTDNDGEPVDGIITNITIPSLVSEMHLLGGYEIELAVPGKSRAVRRSLYSLHEDENFAVYSKGYARELMAKFDEAPEGLVQRRRLMLDGNLFQAAQLAASRNLGSSVVYTDAEGLRHRGVLLSRLVSRKHLDELPVRMESPRLAAAFLEAHPEVTLISTGTRDRADSDHDAAIMIRDGGVTMTVPGTTVRGGPYFKNDALLKVTGAFHGSRKQMVATFPLARLESALAVIYRNGKSFYAPAECREAYNAVKARIYSNQSQDEDSPANVALSA